MPKLRRVLLGEGGLGASVGTLLFIGAGLAFVWRGVSDLNEAVHAQPAEQPCEQFLTATARAPTEQRWVALTGCRLELEHSQVNRGQLLVPLRARGSVSGEPPRALVAPSNPELQRLDSPQKVEAFLAGQPAGIETTLAPMTLVALVEPRGGPDGALLLTQGRPTPRLRSVGGVLFGMALMVLGLLPVARRWRLETE